MYWLSICEYFFQKQFTDHPQFNLCSASTIYTVPVGIIDDESSIDSQKAYGNPRRYPERPPTYDDAVRAEQSW